MIPEGNPQLDGATHRWMQLYMMGACRGPEYLRPRRLEDLREVAPGHMVRASDILGLPCKVTSRAQLLQSQRRQPESASNPDWST